MRYLLCVLALVTTACNSERGDKYANASVTDVRIVYHTFNAVPATAGNPVTGAVVGYMLAGKVGAVVGSASQSGEPAKPSSTKISACRFTAKFNGREYVYVADRMGASLARCALLKDGDHIQLIDGGSGSGKFPCWPRGNMFGCIESDI